MKLLPSVISLLAFSLLLPLLACRPLVAQENVTPVATAMPSPSDRLKSGLQELMHHYDTSRGLWDTEGWWNAANSTDLIGEAVATDPDATSVATLRTTFSKAQTKFPLFRNNFYDDEGWWALAWIQAFDVTKDPAYLNMAQSIFQDMIGGWDNTCGGGIWWSKDRHYKNAIANELFLSVAAHLAARTDGPNKQAYLAWANRDWKWFHASSMINDQALVNDGLTDDCKNNGRTTWTYNQGVLIGGLAELSRVGGDGSLLREAQLVAHATLTHLTDADMILHDRTEPHCSPDTAQFKGIFVRNLLALQKAAPDEAYVRFFRANADSIWTTARTTQNEFACSWTGPPDGADAATSTSALEALVAAVAVK